MICEIRTYDLKPTCVPEYQERFGEKIAGRQKFSKLGGHFYTEVGPLNQVVALWPYDSLGQRSQIRKQAEAASAWPPKTNELINYMKSEIYIPAPFSPPMTERSIGPVYEMRIYTYAPEDIPRVLEAWGNAIGAREKLSPLAGCWYSEAGGADNFIHMWAYRSFEERLRIRQEAKDKDIWPPKNSGTLLRQVTKIMFPAPFSPMQ